MSYTFELNNERKDANFVSGKVNAKSPVVEIFSAMVAGKDLSKYGKKADEAAKFIGELNQRAVAGDMQAVSELNEIRRFAMEPVLMKEISLMGIFGNYQNVGWNESTEIEVPYVANDAANIQAAGQDVRVPVMAKKRISVPTITISGGHAVDYRKAQLGDMSDENMLQEQVRVQIRNKAAKYVVDTVYTAIKNATGVKYFFEAAGLTKTGVDGVISKVRRFGRPTISGDYALVSQLNGFAGYQGVTPNVTGISQNIMDELNKNGLLAMYNGSVVAEIPNEYDLTALNKAGDNFATLLPANLGFVMPTGVQSPVFTVTRGGLTSMSGNDVSTGSLIQRFDLEVGAIVVPGQEHKIGILSDTNLA